MFFQFIPFGLWLTALFSGIRVPFFTLFGMRFRRVDPRAIVLPLISGHKAGIQLNVNDLEGHFLAGGNVNRVVNALISADKAGIALTYKQATAIDLAGRDVFEAVQVSVNPKVITTPKVAAMAKDGIQLLALARVTVRANINRLVGGAGEETILARVGEGIVSTIGSAASHKAVLENPDLISKTVLAKGLDAGTAFEILSIDIADVDVGKNIGAELQTDQAEADKRIAQAKAEERRALAVAMEQEFAHGSGIKFSILSSGPLSIGKLAPRQLTYGLKFRMTVGSRKIDGRIDIYFFSRGRADGTIAVEQHGQQQHHAEIDRKRGERGRKPASSIAVPGGVKATGKTERGPQAQHGQRRELAGG